MTMTDERAPEAPRDERLLSDEELAAVQSTIDHRKSGYSLSYEDWAVEAGELLYLAWAVIANAGQGMGGWEHESAEWVGAAERWRDRWHAFIAPVRATGEEGE